MTKIEASGNKERLEHQAAKQDWEGTTMTKHEAVQDVKHLPKDSQGLTKSPSGSINSPQAVFDTKPDARTNASQKAGVPFQPPPQSGEVGLRKYEVIEEKNSPSARSKTSSYPDTTAPASAKQQNTPQMNQAPNSKRAATSREVNPGRISTEKNTPNNTGAPDIVSSMAHGAMDVAAGAKEKVVQGSEVVADKALQLKDKALEKGAEMKDKALEKGAEMKDKALEKGAEMKDKALVKGAEIKDRLSETGNSPSQIKNRALEKAEEIKDRASEKGAEIKNRANQKGAEIKNNVNEKGAEIKNRVNQKGAEMKQSVVQKGEEVKSKAKGAKQEADDWAKLEAELARNKLNQGERIIEQKKDQFVSGIKGAEDKAASEVKDFGHAVAETTKEVKEGLYTMGGDMKEGAQQRWVGFKQTVAEAPRAIVQEGEYLGKVVKDKIVSAEEKIKETVWGSEEKAKENVKDNVEWAKTKASGAYEAGKEKMKDSASRAGQQGKEALYDTEIKAKEYAQKSKDSMGSLRDSVEETIRGDIDKAQNAGRRASAEIKRDAGYAKEKAGQVWEEGKSEAQKLKDKASPSLTDKVVNEAKDFGGAVSATVKDVKDGLTPSASTEGSAARSSSLGEAINKAFTSTSDTNRPSSSEWNWNRIDQNKAPSSGSVPLMSDESETRKILRERVIEEEKTSPGFVASMMEFVFGHSRNPDLTTQELSEQDKINQRAARINSVAYSPAGGITPEDLQDEPVLVTSPSLPIRRHSIAGDKPLSYPADSEAARKLDRLSSIQYSPAMGAPSELSAKKLEETHFSLPTFTTYDSHHLPLESNRSSYFQTYRTAMPSEEVEERVLESTIDFFY